MICTEEEARTKWCTFARLKYTDTVSANSTIRIDETKNDIFHLKCIASDCMAWCVEVLRTDVGRNAGFCGRNYHSR